MDRKGVEKVGRRLRTVTSLRRPSLSGNLGHRTGVEHATETEDILSCLRIFWEEKVNITREGKWFEFYKGLKPDADWFLNPWRVKATK